METEIRYKDITTFTIYQAECTMKALSVKELKEELRQHPNQGLIDLCLRLSKFKKENKELLTYLLYYSANEPAYVKIVKQEVNEEFSNINRSSYYFIKKSIRRILKMIRKYVRYSGKKETEVELLIFFCKKLKEFQPSIKNNVALMNLYRRQMDTIRKSISTLHEDLQYDYQSELDKLGF